MEPQEQEERAPVEEEAPIQERQLQGVAQIFKAGTPPREEEESDRLEEPGSPGLPEARDEVPQQTSSITGYWRQLPKYKKSYKLSSNSRNPPE